MDMKKGRCKCGGLLHIHLNFLCHTVFQKDYCDIFLTAVEHSG
ncbi:hypothetical protein [uncultured Megasphaera sp.]|nr:hypothetical protein [uncultured Megasphaera sp.]